MSEREANQRRHRPAVSCGFLLLTVLLSATLLLIVAWPAGASSLLSLVEQRTDIPIQQPDDLVVSADGRNVYVVGESAVTVLERDPVTGITTLLEAHLEGRGELARLRSIRNLALAGDERFAYVVSQHTGAGGADRNAVAIFERDPSDGGLRLLDIHTDGFVGDASRFPADRAVASPDGSHLYVVAGRAVLAFDRDPSSGTLHFLEAIEELTCVTRRVFAAFDPEGRHLYLTDVGCGSVSSFQRDPATGALSFVEELTSEDPDNEQEFPVFPTSLVVTPDGEYVYVTNGYAFPFDGEDGTIVCFRRDRSTGALTLLAVPGFQASPKRMAMSADGVYLYVAGAGGGFGGPSGVGIYRRDGSDGGLERVDYMSEDSAFRLDFASPTRAVAISGDGRHVYAGNFERQPVVVFERTDDGRLTLIEDPTDPAGGRGQLLGAERAVVSPDGRHVYVASPASDSLTVFERRGDGSLAFVELLIEPSLTETVAISPDGRWVYAFDSVFARDSGSGRLERVEQDELTNFYFVANDIAVAPDSRHVYMASRGFDAGPVLALAQVPASGQLAEVEVAIDAVPGFGEPEWSRSVAVSPDGDFVYAVGVFVERSPGNVRAVEAVWVLARDPATGSLALELFDPLGPLEFGTPEPRLTLSPDGRHLYLARPTANELRVYEHRRRAGRLVLVETHQDGAFGVEGMSEPRDVVVTASGHLVYVAGRSSDAVALFARDPASGRLTFLEALGEDTPAGEGLFRVEALAASPDNRHVYASSSRLSSITALTLDCTDAPDALCLAEDRFRVDVEWRTGAGGTGPGRKVPLSSENSGLFWFFDADNWEMLVKVLDGCAVNDHFWVFAAATTDVEYTLRVTDTRTGAQQRYFNPLGTASAAITDTSAFRGCE